MNSRSLALPTFFAPLSRKDAEIAYVALLRAPQVEGGYGLSRDAVASIHEVSASWVKRRRLDSLPQGPPRKSKSTALNDLIILIAYEMIDSKKNFTLDDVVSQLNARESTPEWSEKSQAAGVAAVRRALLFHSWTFDRAAKRWIDPRARKITGAHGTYFECGISKDRRSATIRLVVILPGSEAKVFFSNLSSSLEKRQLPDLAKRLKSTEYARYKDRTWVIGLADAPCQFPEVVAFLQAVQECLPPLWRG